jgi:hypothetical protein
MELDAGGGVQLLEPRNWYDHWRLLEERGGRPKAEPTMTAPREDRRKRLGAVGGLDAALLDAAGG